MQELEDKLLDVKEHNRNPLEHLVRGARLKSFKTGVIGQYLDSNSDYFKAETEVGEVRILMLGKSKLSDLATGSGGDRFNPSTKMEMLKLGFVGRLPDGTPIFTDAFFEPFLCFMEASEFGFVVINLFESIPTTLFEAETLAQLNAVLHNKDTRLELIDGPAT